MCTLHGVLDLLNVADQRPMGLKRFALQLLILPVTLAAIFLLLIIHTHCAHFTCRLGLFGVLCAHRVVCRMASSVLLCDIFLHFFSCCRSDEVSYPSLDTPPTPGTGHKWSQLPQ